MKKENIIEVILNVVAIGVGIFIFYQLFKFAFYLTKGVFGF
jgi:hypothetical protein